MSENIKENELVYNENQDFFIKNYKSIYHAMTATSENKSVVFSRRIVVGLDDLDALYTMVTDKLDIQYENAGNSVVIYVSIEGKQNMKFIRWEDFIKYRWNESNPIQSIMIKWEYHVCLPKYQVPQPHVLVVKISNGLKPEQMLNLVFTGKLENIENIDEEIYPVVARIDYIDPIIGDELLNIVKKWDDGLKRSLQKENNVIKFMRKHRRIISYGINYSTLLIGAFWGLIYINSAIIKLGELKLAEIKMEDLCKVTNAFFVSAVVCFVLHKLSEFFANNFFRYIHYSDAIHVFNIDNGDKNKQNELSTQDTKSIRKAITSFVITLLINIITTVFISFFYKT